MANNIGTILNRVRQGLGIVTRTTSTSAAERLIQNLPPVVEEKQRAGKDTTSQLDVRRTTTNYAYGAAYAALRSWYMMHADQMPGRDDPNRDFHLGRAWMEEPILAGAVYSMVAKMTSLRWSITGRRLQARNAARLFAEAAHLGGYDWGGFISSTAQDFYTVNRGVFWETPRDDIGKLTALGHIDALCCFLTGNRAAPVQYVSELTNQQLWLKPGEFIHFASLPSARERNLGAGFCAVDRAWRAVQLLMGLSTYDIEKLNNLPPEGIATVTGLTMDEFNDAVTLWKNQRKADKSLTFPQVLWLIGSQPNTDVKVALQGFSTLPESFNRKDVVQQYINTLALDFGVDAREFWTITSGALGTGSESEIQHLKAKGKGPGEFISTTERFLNAELPEDAEFGFDTQDIEEDSNAAAVCKAWVDAFYPLYTGVPAGKSKASPGGMPNTQAVPNREEVPEKSMGAQAGGGQPFGGAPGAPQPEQVITKDQLLRLLADKGVLPDWMVNDERVVIYDSEVHLTKEDADGRDYCKISWKDGTLFEERAPAIVLWSGPEYHPDALPVQTRYERAAPHLAPSTPLSADNHALREAFMLLRRKELEVLEQERNIKGNPIPESEALRGSGVTAKTLKAELERWRKDPILSKYALTAEEEAELLAKANNGAKSQ